MKVFKKYIVYFIILTIFIAFNINNSILVKADIVNNKQIQYIPPINLITKVGEPVGLPDKAFVIFSDYSSDDLNAKWNTFNSNIFNAAGNYEVNGTIENTNESIKAIINVFPKDKQVKIAAVGASITYGFGVSSVSKYAYSAQMNIRLGQGYLVNNYGVSGRTVMKNTSAPYVKAGKYQQSLAFNPDAVCILMGSNDTKPGNWKNSDKFISDYIDIITSYKKLPSNPIIYICTPPDILKDGTYGMSIKNYYDLVKKIKQVSEEMKMYNVSFIDVEKALQGNKQFFPDNVHPNNEGTALMGNSILRAIRGKDVTIKTKKQEARNFTDMYGMYLADSLGNSSGKKLIGINNNDWVSFSNVDFNQNNGYIDLNIACLSNVKVDIHIDSKDGQIIGSQLFTKTSGINTFKTQKIMLQKITGSHDVYFTFSSSTRSNSTGLAKASWIDFTP